MLARLAALAVALAAGGAAAGPQFEWLQLDRYHVKWGAPTAGAGTAVSYAFVAGSTHTPDARNCRDMRSFEGLTVRSRLSLAALEAEAEAAFAMWQAAADIRFHRVVDAGDADILIGAQADPSGVAFADVAYGGAEDEGVRSIRRSLVCLNPEKRWTIGFDGDTETYDLRYALAHEIGHAIGLDHPGPSGQLMSFRYDELFRNLQPGDVAGAIRLYGAGETMAAHEPPTVERAGGNATAAAEDCPAGPGGPSNPTALTPRDDRC